MARIDIELGGKTFSARLLEDRAPKTCEALLKGLPFSGRAIHTTWSGNLIHVLDKLPLDSAPAEEQIGMQYHGLVMYVPSRQEIAISYADSRYRHSGGPEYVIPVALLEGDLEAFGKEAAKLQFEGVGDIQIRAGAGEAAAAAPREGRKLAINFDGVEVTATLLEEESPRTVAAFVSLLPLERLVTNTKWSGAMAHFWGGLDDASRAGRGPIGLHVSPQENPTAFHQPGTIYYHPAYGGIRICYGDGQQSGAFNTSYLTAVAKIDGDWSAFREKAEDLVMTGARPMSIKVIE